MKNWYLTTIIAIFALGSLASAEDYKTFLKIRKPLGNAKFHYSCNAKAELNILVKGKDDDSYIEITIASGSPKVIFHDKKNSTQKEVTEVIINQSFDANKNYPEAEFSLKFRETYWSLYLQDQLIMTMPALLKNPVELQTTSANSAKLKGKSRFQPVTDLHFSSDFMIPKDATTKLYPWEEKSGKWHLHTALQDALARTNASSRIKSVPLTASQSPNFYSLKGSGEYGLIITGYPFYDDYHYAVALQCNHDAAGLIFYYQDQDNYFAYTLHLNPEDKTQGEARLWQRQNGKNSIIKRVKLPLFSQQWYRPAVSINNGKISCFLDRIELMNAKPPMPIGGKIGLWVNSKEESRFDDVLLRPINKLVLQTVADIRQVAKEHSVGLFRDKGAFFKKRTPDEQKFIHTEKSKKGEVLQFRTISFANYFTTDLHLKSGKVIIEAKFANSSNWQFGVAKNKFVLTKDGKTLKESINKFGELRNIAIDLSETGIVKCYANKQLILISPRESDDDNLQFSLLATPSSDVTFKNISFHAQRPERYLEQQQKNLLYAKDPYMRHWASLAGQWIADDKKQLWFKGDFYHGLKMCLPILDGSTIHLGVKEQEITGQIQIKTSDGKAKISGLAVGEIDIKIDKQGCFTIHLEDYCLWLTANDKILGSLPISKKVTGTRLRLEKYGSGELAKCVVTRQHLINEFFTQAPYNWTINGGLWQVINRFQCKPSWSNMVGESKDSLASIWFKQRFKGDMTLEFYAGMRHGWYERAGDLNCTMMANTTSTNSGYSITCTGWDYDLSQYWTKLWKNGNEKERSDKYLVPQSRFDAVRRWRNPLTPKGRPLHGAWFYLKLRRINGKVEFYFDNELIFSHKDDELLDDGLLGIWTFMNSMTLANVKISFSDTVPSNILTTVLNNNIKDPATPLADSAVAVTKMPNDKYEINNHPLDLLQKQNWKLADKAGHSSFKTRHDRRFGTVIRVQNNLGGGAMNLTPKVAPKTLLDDIAGWSFYIRRTTTQPVNFHYSIQRGDSKHDKVYHYYHQLSGSDFSRGDYKISGKSEVAPIKDFANPANGWQKVIVWIPESFRKRFASYGKLKVKVNGFGNFQANYHLAGLQGPMPNDGYEIALFQPILYKNPVIKKINDKPTESKPSFRCLLANHASEKAVGVDELNSSLQKSAKVGFNEVEVLTDNGSIFLDWVKLPAITNVKLTWHKTLPNRVICTHDGDYPDPNFAKLRLRFMKTSIKFIYNILEPISFELPLKNLLIYDAKELPLTIYFSDKKRREEILLSLIDRPNNSGPVLLSLNGLTPVFDNFETKNSITTRTSLNSQKKSANGYREQITNRSKSHRLSFKIKIGKSLAKYPLLQFNYKTSNMGNVSGKFTHGGLFHLSESKGRSKLDPTIGAKFQKDEKWHTWLGDVQASMSQPVYNYRLLYPWELEIRSFNNKSQTGCYSRIDYDNFVMGPAINSAEALTFQPEFFDFDGVKNISHCISPTNKAWLNMSKAEQVALKWQIVGYGKKITPNIEGLKDGVFHLLVKATDLQGRDSNISDIPCLLDRKPLAISTSFTKESDPFLNGKRLKFSFNHGKSSTLQLSKLALSCDGEKTSSEVWKSFITSHQQKLDITLNYAFFCRDKIQSLKDGESYTLAYDNIIDGAGNKSPQFSETITLDFKSDKQIPAWHSISATNNLHATELIYTKKFMTNYKLLESYTWEPTKYQFLSFQSSLKQKISYLTLTAVDRKGKKYSVKLTPNLAINCSEIAWSVAKTHYLTFDIAKLLHEKGMPLDGAKKLYISAHGKKTSESPVTINNFWIHSALSSAKSATVTMVAYDESGIAGLVVEFINQKNESIKTITRDNTKLDLCELRKIVKENCWLKVKAKDRAGNLSQAIWIPLF